MEVSATSLSWELYIAGISTFISYFERIFKVRFIVSRLVAVARAISNSELN